MDSCAVHESSYNKEALMMLNTKMLYIYREVIRANNMRLMSVFTIL